MKAKFIFLLLHATIFNYAIGADTTDGILLGGADDIEAAISRPRSQSSLNTEGADSIRSNDSSVIAHRTGIREQATFKFEVQRLLNFYKKLLEVSSSQEIFWGSYYNLKYSHQNLPL